MNMVTTSRSTGNVVAVGLVSGVLVALPAIAAAVISGGAGHGDYVAARGLFPTPMLLTLLEGDRIGAISIGVGLLQFPIYGALIGWSVVRRNNRPVVVIALAHMIAALVCFTGTLPNFS